MVNLKVFDDNGFLVAKETFCNIKEAENYYKQYYICDYKKSITEICLKE